MGVGIDKVILLEQMRLESGIGPDVSILEYMARSQIPYTPDTVLIIRNSGKLKVAT